MTIGEKIAKARREKRLTQEELADRLGVSRQAVSKWESGAALPETDKLARLSGLLGVSCDYLLCDDAAEEQGNAFGRPRQEAEAGQTDQVKMEEKDARCLHRRPLTSGGVAVVAILVVAGALLALLSAIMLFTVQDNIELYAPTFIILFFFCCALVLIGVIVKLFLNK